MRLRNRLGTGLVAAIVGVALVATACGKSSKSSSSNGTTGTTTAQVACATGTITGAGSTFVQTIAQQWIKDFQAKCSGATINYQGVGSGAGITQFNAGTVDFGASDAVMKPEEEAAAKAKGGDVLHIPWSAGGIAIEFHLSGVTDLKLSPDTLAGIFAGTVKTWNASEIKADNSGASLPSTPIQVVHRSDGSGTTFIFTDYLSKVSPEWSDKVGESTAVEWPVGLGGKGNEGVAALVSRTDGAIGYVEYAYAKQNKLAYALLSNKEGVFNQPNAGSFQAAAANADWQKAPGYYLLLTDQPGKESWPITGASFILMYKKQDKPETAKQVLQFFDWSYRNGQKMADELDYVPMPENVVKLVEDAWKKEMSDPGNKPVWTGPAS